METVTIKLGGQKLFRVTEYKIHCGIFSQPNSFECTIGRPYVFRVMAEAFPPRTPYQIYMDNTLIQSGFIDGFTRSGGDLTQIRLTGRGALGMLTRKTIDKRLSFASPTYFKLVEEALERSGLNLLLKRLGIESPLIGSNEANRKAFTGTKKAKATSPETEEVIQTEVGAIEGDKTKKVYEYVRAQVGTTWWAFLVEQLRRAGLFLWEASDGQIILATPSAEQLPVFRLVRTHEENNILDDSFAHDTANRHSECIVYGRGKKGKAGSPDFDGRYVDEEMVAFLNPDPNDRADGGVIRLEKTVRDKQITSQVQAEALARREIAEERRSAWRLSYTIQGHSLPGIGNDGRVRPAPECVCEVQDDDLGLYGQLFVEAVDFIGDDSATLTMMEMQRPGDIFFRIPDAPPKSKLAARGANAQINTDVIINAVATLQGRLRPEFTTGGFSYPDDMARVLGSPPEEESVTENGILRSTLDRDSTPR